MKKRNKKIVAGVLTLAVAVSMGGCTDKGETNGTNGEIPTIQYLLPSDPGVTFTSDTWAIKEWGEAVGVNFEIISPPRDTFKEKLAATIASGNLPDMINYYNDEGVDTYKTYGERLFVPLNEYIENGQLPNLKKWLDKYPDIAEKITSAEDGNIYGFPLVLDFDAFYSLWTVRNDLLKKAGYEADNIKTLDQLKEALLALKEVSGEQYITSSRLGWNYFATQTGYFFGTSPTMMYDNRTSQGTNQYVYGPTTDAYKTWIEFYKWMYDNKLIHPNFATMQQQELYAGYGDGKFTLCMEQATMGYMLGGNDEKYPEREEKHLFPVEINGEIPKQPALYHQNNGFRWPVTISKSSKVIDACIKAMDWGYSEEGYDMFLTGKEGEHWEKDDGYINGRRTINLQSNSTQQMVLDGTMTQEEYDALPTGQSLGIGSWWLAPVITPETRFSLMDTVNEKRDKAMFTVNDVNKWIETGNVLDPDPIVEFNKEEKDEITNILTPLDTYASEQSLKFILGQKDMSEWDAFQAEMVNMKVDRLEEIYNSKLNK